MKQFIAALLIAGTVFSAAGQAKACDCGIATVPVDGKDYAYTVFTVEGFKHNYVTLKSTINGEVDDYYLGFVHPGANLKTGGEAVILYDMDKDFEITQILEVDNE